MGETWADRVDLALTLLEAGVFSVPVNFLSPIPGTPLGARPVLSPDEARRIVILLRFLLPDRHIRICGGRPTVFGAHDPLAPMARGRIPAHPDNVRAEGGKPGQKLRELQGLGGAAGCGILGIEIEHQPAAGKVGQPAHGARGIGQGEIRGRGARIGPAHTFGHGRRG